MKAMLVIEPIFLMVMLTLLSGCASTDARLEMANSPAPSSSGPNQIAALNWKYGPGVPIQEVSSSEHQCGKFGALEMVPLGDGKYRIRCREVTLMDLIRMGAAGK
jgi:hypothetical protein